MEFITGDEFGPTKIIQIYEPTIGLCAALVIDNLAVGPSLGGIRIAADVTIGECCRLARAMTFKNAAAQLPYGGGKVVIRADPKMPRAQKERLIRGLACALRDIREYILAPDMGTNEECMAWIRDEVDRVVCLPRELGGIPLDEIGATGWGLRHAADIAAAYCDLDLRGARVAIQGFGAVGAHASRFLAEAGAVVVAAADTSGTIYDPDGLNVANLIELKRGGGRVVDAPNGEKRSSDAVLFVDSDILIPAARPDAIGLENMQHLKARMILQGANIPVAPAAEERLHRQGVLCVPDFIANAGGVICAAMEYAGATEAAALATIEEKIRRNTKQVLERAVTENITPRLAAVELATQRLKTAMRYRRWSIF